MLGAYLNRRGMPRVYDFNSDMKRLRSQLDILGVSSKNYYNSHPTLSDGMTNPMNPLNTPEFKKAIELAEKMDIKTDVYEKTEIPLLRKSQKIKIDGVEYDSSVSTMVSQKNLSLFNAYYNWLTGVKGKKHTKPKDHISEVDAKRIEQEIQKIEFNGKKVKDVFEFNKAMEKVSNDLTDAFTKRLAIGSHKLLSEGTEFNPDPIKANDNIGRIPAAIDIPQSLINKAKKGEFDWLLSKEGIKLEGEAAVARIVELRKKGNTLLNMWTELPHADIGLKPTTVANEAQLVKYIENILSLEKSINKGLRSRKEEGFEFKLEDLSELGMKTPIIARYFRQTIDRINSTLDVKNDDSFNQIKDILAKRGILTRDEDVELGYRLLKNPRDQIILKESDGVSSAKQESAKQFLVDFLGILGSKKQLNVDGISKVEVTYDIVDD